MTTAEFERAFSKGIRAAVNWRAVRRSSWRVSCRVLGGGGTDKLLVPWYAKGSALTDPRRHLTVAAATRLPPKTAHHSKQILSIASRLRDGDVICAPAVKTKHGTVLLDGCHRVIASRLSPCAVTVMVFTVHPKGPGRAAFWDA